MSETCNVHIRRTMPSPASRQHHAYKMKELKKEAPEKEPLHDAAIQKLIIENESEMKKMKRTSSKRPCIRNSTK